MRVALCMLALCACLPPAVCAGGDVRDLPPRSAAMGGAGCALGSRFLSLLNPAGAAEGRSGGEVYWTPKRFGFSEMGSMNAGWKQVFSAYTATAQLQRFGYDMYSELRLDVSAAAMFDSAVTVGMRAAVHVVSIHRYGNAVATGIDIGTRVRVTQGLYLGAAAENAVQTGFTDGERLPLLLRLGAGWKIGGVQVAFDTEMRMRSAVCLRFGCEYRVHEAVWLRAGMAHDPQSVTAGCGFLLAGVHIDYAVMVHPDLGWTHTAGIGFQP